MPDLHILSGAYALDSLDEIERAGFERHLRSCGSCPAEVLEFQEATASLAERVAMEPPAQLRSRVLTQVARTRQASPIVRVRRSRPSLRRLLAVAAAGVVIAGTAGLGGVAWQSQRTADDATVAAAREAAKAAAITRVLTDPDKLEASKRPSIGGTAVVVAARGKAVLATDALPAAPSGKVYQVWRIDKNSTISSAGLLKLANGAGQSVVDGVGKGDTVAISVEPAGGSRQPSTKPIVAIPVA
jgi:anti-sigma-K factor RskA